jgi:hypothetical protein
MLCKLQEGPFDMSALKSMLFSGGAQSAAAKASMAAIYLKMMNSQSTMHTVEYTTPKSGFGNLVADVGSIQKLPNDVKRLITTSLTDVDMVCSGMTIVSQVFEKLDMPCPLLQNFITNRESILPDVQKALDAHQSVKMTAKQYVEMLFNGGTLAHVRIVKLVPLVEECYKLRSTLYSHVLFAQTDTVLAERLRSVCPVYKEIFDIVNEKPLPRAKQEVRFMARIKDYFQSKILECMIECIGHDDVSTLTCDGLLARGKVDLPAIEAYVLKHRSFKIVLKQKPFSMTAQEKQVLLPTRNNTGIDWGDIPCFNHPVDEMIEYKDTHGQMKRGMDPIEFKPGVRCMIYGAHMATGKTHNVKACVHDLQRQLGREPSVIFVTARRLQGMDIAAMFGNCLTKILYYSHADDGEALQEALQLIIQYESICRLKGRDTPYDLFIFDECRQVCAQSTSIDTNRGNLMNNFEVMCTLLTWMADRCVLLDADIEFDGLIRDIVKHIFKPHEVEVHRYLEYQPLQRSVILFAAQASLFEDLKAFIGEKGRDVRVFITFRQRSTLQAVMQVLLKAFPWLVVLGLHKDCPKENLDAMKDVNHYLTANGINIMCITSTITVGLDVQVLFDRIYAFSEGASGCSAMNTTQGLARVRRVSDTQIRMCVGGDKYKNTVLPYSNSMSDFLADKKKREKYAQFLMDSLKSCNDQKKWVFVSGLHETMFGWSRSLELTSYQFTFEKLCYMKGWEITHSKPLTDETKSAEERIKNSRIKIKNALCAEYAAVLKNIISENPVLESDCDQKRVEVEILLKHLGYAELAPEDQPILINLLLVPLDSKKAPEGIDIYDLVKQNRENIHLMREYRWYTDVYLNDPEDITYYDASIVMSEKIANFIKIRGQVFPQIKAIIDMLPQPEFDESDLAAIEKQLRRAGPPRKKAHTMLKQLLKKVGMRPVATSRTRTKGTVRVQCYEILPLSIFDKFGSYIRVKAIDMRQAKYIRAKEHKRILADIVASAQKSSLEAAQFAAIARDMAHSAMEAARHSSKRQLEIEKDTAPIKRTKH